MLVLWKRRSYTERLQESQKATGKRQLPTVEAPIVGHTRADQEPLSNTNRKQSKKALKTQTLPTTKPIDTHNHYSPLELEISQPEGEWTNQGSSSIEKRTPRSDLDGNSDHTSEGGLLQGALTSGKMGTSLLRGGGCPRPLRTVQTMVWSIKGEGRRPEWLAKYRP